MPNKYDIASEWSAGFTAALKPEPISSHASGHWKAGFSAGYELRSEKRKLLNTYLETIGAEPMAMGGKFLGEALTELCRDSQKERPPAFRRIITAFRRIINQKACLIAACVLLGVISKIYIADREVVADEKYKSCDLYVLESDIKSMLVVDDTGTYIRRSRSIAISLTIGETNPTVKVESWDGPFKPTNSDLITRETFILRKILVVPHNEFAAVVNAERAKEEKKEAIVAKPVTDKAADQPKQQSPTEQRPVPQQPPTGVIQTPGTPVSKKN